MVKFKAGDLIEQCLPIAYALDSNEAGQRCDFCFCTFPVLRKCPDCESTFYCSKECLRDDWRHSHKYGECELMQGTNCSRLRTDTQQLVLRMFLKCKRKPKVICDKRTLFDGRKRSLGDLVHHEEAIRECPGRMKLFDEMLDILEGKAVNSSEEKDLLFRIYCQVLINSFAILDPERRSKFTRVGAVLYIEGSAYDHSCAPNSIQWFVGTQLQIKALRDFDTKLEPVVIHYIDLKLPLEERRTKLDKQYYFRCECNRCVTEAMGMKTVDYEEMFKLEEEARTITKEFSSSDKLLSDRVEAIRLAAEFLRVRTELLPMYERAYGLNHPFVRHVAQNIHELRSKLDKVDANLKECEESSRALNSSCSFANKLRELLPLKAISLFAAAPVAKQD